MLLGAKVEVTNSISDGGNVEVLAALLPVSSFEEDAGVAVETGTLEETLFRTHGKGWCILVISRHRH